METIKKLDNEKFKEIYIDEKLRNDVAFAHIHAQSNGKFMYKATCSYPVKYIVTDEQIKEAKALIDKRKIEVLKENKTNLLFCGMGMEFKPNFKDGVGNHRIRTEFKNSEGKVYFIEIGTSCKDDTLRINHSIDRDKQDQLRDSFDKQSLFYNFADLERKTPQLKFTYENVLKLVNEYFNCNFKKMVVDYYNISCDIVLCESPKINEVV